MNADLRAEGKKKDGTLRKNDERGFQIEIWGVISSGLGSVKWVGLRIRRRRRGKMLRGEGK